MEHTISKNRPTALQHHSVWGRSRAMALRCLQGCKRTVYQSSVEAAVNNTLSSSEPKPRNLQDSLLHRCRASPMDPWHVHPGDAPAGRVLSAPECNSVWCAIRWTKMAASLVRAGGRGGGYNHSWSGAKKSSCLWVNYFETSKRRLVLKSSITYLWWTAYKSPAGNGEEWAAVPAEHLQEFAYTSQMKWCSSCCNSKNDSHFKRECWREANAW